MCFLFPWRTFSFKFRKKKNPQLSISHTAPEFLFLINIFMIFIIQNVFFLYPYLAFIWRSFFCLLSFPYLSSRYICFQASEWTSNSGCSASLNPPFPTPFTCILHRLLWRQPPFWPPPSSSFSHLHIHRSMSTPLSPHPLCYTVLRLASSKPTFSPQTPLPDLKCVWIARQVLDLPINLVTTKITNSDLTTSKHNLDRKWFTHHETNFTAKVMRPPSFSSFFLSLFPNNFQAQWSNPLI